MYELGKVTLDGIEGQGYAFSRKTAFGKTFQGVFFPKEEEDLEELQEREKITFSGPVYHRRRNRSARRATETLEVAIENTISSPMGERARFESTEPV